MIRLRYILSVTLCIGILLTSAAYALNLDKLKTSFLKGDYKSAIAEGEKVLAKHGKEAYGLDELYYILGLCYLRDSNYLRASDIFEIIIKEFKDSEYKEEAKLGLGDTYLLLENFDKAKSLYKDILAGNSRSKLDAQVYYRLAQLAYKQGDNQTAEEYTSKLKKEFPLTPELKLNNELFCDFSSTQGMHYAVQVGVFSSAKNARNLTEKLVSDGYPAFTEEAVLGTEKAYRVKVGKFNLRAQAEEMKNKLSREGYPTRICP